MRIPWTVPSIPQDWDGTGHWDLGILEDGTCENPMDSPVHPTGLWDGTGHCSGILGVYIEEWMGWDAGILFSSQSHPSHRTVGRDGTLGFGGILEDGTCENPMDSPVHPTGL